MLERRRLIIRIARIAIHEINELPLMVPTESRILLAFIVLLLIITKLIKFLF